MEQYEVQLRDAHVALGQTQGQAQRVAAATYIQTKFRSLREGKARSWLKRFRVLDFRVSGGDGVILYQCSCAEGIMA